MVIDGRDDRCVCVQISINVCWSIVADTRLDHDPTQTQKELAITLGVTQQAIFHRSKEIGMFRKVKNWVRKGFLHRIVTVDEKWAHYDYPKHWTTYLYPGCASSSMAKPNIHGGKIMLCIWWDHLGVSGALREKRLQYANRHDKTILQHDNARPHAAAPVKTYSGTSTYERPNIRVFRDTSRRASDFLLLVTSEIRDTGSVQ
ncbi:hypothetical protein LAZ67_19002261 [Cordylochernes scorpioides]|uniref:Mariner Mos1 transposase n=1 Tax=Cordylochernes scorpioides TaxID=51811 RepID=A0ABY6LID5_9ARAC|nr:hypothetical protein LAZ67_19002261 [Cordylochernes scorpioides]